MQIVRTPASARAIARTLRRPLGFVPTMGSLHAGHAELVRRARAENASVVASIFVNPLQFGPTEDYARYPRAFDADVALLEAAGVDLLYAPDVRAIYPGGFASSIDVGALATRFEGAARPGHFSGVATVVAKLLHAIEPTTLYLGQKDAQQVAVVRRMLRDFDFAPALAVVPTVREPDGLARSSRNVYLATDERVAAASLARALDALVGSLVPVAGAPGESVADAIERARGELARPLRWEYLAVVDPVTFEPLETVDSAIGAVAIGAAYAGATRLIDNGIVPAADGGNPLVTPPPNRTAASPR